MYVCVCVCVCVCYCSGSLHEMRVCVRACVRALTPGCFKADGVHGGFDLIILSQWQVEPPEAGSDSAYDDCLCVCCQYF